MKEVYNINNEFYSAKIRKKPMQNWTTKNIDHFKDTNLPYCLPHFKTSTSIWGRNWGKFYFDDIV